MAHPDVVVIVVALDHSPRLESCLAAVRASVSDLKVETICVVVHPRASPHEESRGGVRYLFPGINLGWAGAIHLARAHATAPVLWLIQDDVRVSPAALERLHSALSADAGLAAVRPLVIDEGGLVPAGSCGSVLDAAGNQSVPIPSRATAPGEFDRSARPSYLPSGGLMVRVRAWDQVGGFDPWFYPVNWIDVDFGLSLSHAGWRFALAPDAQVNHPAKGSTPSMLGEFSAKRNHVLLRAKWFPDAMPTAEERRKFVAESIVDAVRGGRAMPRQVTLGRLAAIAGESAADSYLRFAKWQSQGMDAALGDYRDTVEARDWWKEQCAKACQDYENAIAERDQWRAAYESAAQPDAPRMRHWVWGRRNR